MSSDILARLDAASDYLDEQQENAEERLAAGLRDGEHLAALDRAARRIATLEEQVADLEQQVRQLRDEAFVAWSRVAEAELALDVAARPSPGMMPGKRAERGPVRPRPVPAPTRGVIQLG